MGSRTDRIRAVSKKTVHFNMPAQVFFFFFFFYFFVFFSNLRWFWVKSSPPAPTLPPFYFLAHLSRQAHKVCL